MHCVPRIGRGMRFVTIVMLALPLVGCVCPDSKARQEIPAIASGTPSAREFENRLADAQEVLYRLLVPNTMARTRPRMEQEVQDLLSRFAGLAQPFKQHPNASIQFLSGKVAGTPAGEQDPAVCALQLLYEIDTESARAVIRQAEAHSHEVVARTARQMLSDHQDLFWGFRQPREDDR